MRPAWICNRISLPRGREFVPPEKIHIYPPSALLCSLSQPCGRRIRQIRLLRSAQFRNQNPKTNLSAGMAKSIANARETKYINQCTCLPFPVRSLIKEKVMKPKPMPLDME